MESGLKTKIKIATIVRGLSQRVKADLNLTSDKFRTLESIMTDKDKIDVRAAKDDPNQTWITYFRPELDDDLVLKPVDQYMDEVRAKDILREEELKRANFYKLLTDICDTKPLIFLYPLNSLFII